MRTANSKFPTSSAIKMNYVTTENIWFSYSVYFTSQIVDETIMGRKSAEIRME